MARFIDAYNLVKAYEAGYVNDPKDFGKETYAGISRRFNPDWPGWKIIDEIKDTYPKEEWDPVMLRHVALQNHLLDIYQTKYWKPWMVRLPQDIGDELFEQAVNLGPHTAQRNFQEALNLLSQNKWKLELDGKVGAKTIEAWNDYMLTASWSLRSVDENVRILLKVLNGLQFEHYREVCAKNPEQKGFFYGWCKRI